MIARLKIRHRLWLLIALAWVALSAFAVYSLHIQKEELMQARRAKTYNTLELAYTVVDNYRRLALAGTLTESRAQELAKAAIGSLRYDGINYFSTYDLDYRMLKHPIMSELEGQDLSELRDKDGVRIVVELVDAARRGKGEFVHYLWPKPGGTVPVPKLSTSRLYEPWGWVLQTGIYIDDVEAEFRRQLAIYGGAIVAATLILLLVSLRIARSISQPLQELQATVSRVANDGEELEMPAVRQDCEATNEIAQLTDAFQAMTARLDAARAELELVAASDALTRLPNRRAFLAYLAGAIERRGQQVVLMFLDLDRFKEINDSLGHPVGDEVLVIVARRLGHVLRLTDLVARLGGDEFALVLEGVDQVEGARGVAEKILRAVSAPIVINDHQLSVSASIGITLYPPEGPPIEELLRFADLALYQAKAAGRGTFSFYTPALGAAAAKRLVIESHLRDAIGRGELVLHYQPKIAAGDAGLAGVEALLRWNSLALGPVPPSDFIPIAEDSGLIVPIGDWVLEESCRQFMAWKAAGLDVGMLAVNVSPRQFRQSGLIEKVEQVLVGTGMPANRLELELTEGVLLDDSPELIEAMARLHAVGVHLAVDDFGTGYSSLSYIKRFPIDRLKIDRSFVLDLESDKDGRAIVRAIIAVAKSLGLRVTAEGVENPKQLALLEAMGCDEFQGYHFGRPLPAGEVEFALMRSAHPARLALPETLSS